MGKQKPKKRAQVNSASAAGAQDGTQLSSGAAAGAQDGTQLSSGATALGTQDAKGASAAVVQDSTDKTPHDHKLDEMPDEELLYDLADLFKVFGDTTRIKILYALMEEDMCVACISDIVGVSQSAVSHQLRALRGARLVKFRKEGKLTIYSLSDSHVHSILSQGLTHICE